MSSPLAPCLRRTPGQARQTPPALRVAAQRCAARRAVRSSATRLGATLGALRKASSGAPLPSGPWHWSLSHGSDWVAGLVHTLPIGVDVERVEERREELVARALSHEERRYFECDEPALAFARAWTAKEAVLKRAGIGLAELSRCLVVERAGQDELWLAHRGQRCLVRQRRFEDQLASVHAAGADWQVDWTDIEAREPGA